jgi:hypothetical protein
MSKKFLVNINMAGNQIISPVLNNPVIYGYSANQANVTGAMYYNTSTNLLNYYNGTAWTPLTTGGTAVTSINSANGSVTIQGTANQIAVTTGSSPITISFPTNVTIPGKTTLSASTTSGSSLNVPAATAAPTTPVVGDIWTTATTGSNILYYNGATKTVAFTDSNITGSAGSVANSLTIGNGLTVAGPYNGSAAVTVSLPSTITAGSVGSGTAVPIITYDTYGRITAVSTASISSSISLAGTSGTGTVSTGGTLTITGGTGITTSASGSTITVTNSGVTSVNGSSGAITGIATLASPTFTGTVTLPLTTAGYVTTTSGGVISSVATIPNAGLTNSSVTVGSTNIALGATATTLAGLTSVSSTGFTGALTGNASTATTLATPRAINGVNFDGSAAITVTAAAGTLTGSTLNATVTGSSLTSVGTITSGTWNGTLVGSTYGGTGVNNGSSTITLAGNLVTSGANSITLTSTGATNVTLPTSGTLATQAYVDAAVASLNVHDSVKVATTTTLAAVYAAGTTGADGGTGIGATITFSSTGTTTLDTSVTLAAGDRVLVKNGVTADAGTASKANGIYYVSTAGTTGVATILTRSEDSNNSIAGEMNTGDFVFVSLGTTYSSTGWVLTTTGTATTPVNGIKIGTDNITYSQFSGTGTYTASGGVTLTGSNFTLTAVSSSSTTDTSTKNIVSSATVNSTGQVTAQTTTALGTEFTNTSGTINLANTSIANGKLTNSSVTIGTSSVALGSTIGLTGSPITGLFLTNPTIGGAGTTFSGSTSGTTIVKANATAGSGTLTLPIATGTLIGTGDTGTVTNAMLANSTISGVALGSNLNALSYGTGLTNTSGASTFNGSATSTVGFATGTTTQTASGVSDGAYAYGAQKQKATITGNGSLTSFAVNHNFGVGNLDFTVQVYDMTTGELVEVDIVKATASTASVTITFATAPTNAYTYKVVMVG